MNIWLPKEESCMLKWGLQSLEMEDFLREKADRVKEKKEEEEERSENRGKVFQSEGDGHALEELFGAKKQVTNRVTH